MKKIKKIFIILLLCLSASSIFASSVNVDQKVNMLSTTIANLSNTDWGSEANVEAGDKVAFQFHYVIADGYKAENIKIFLENLDGRVFKKGDKETVWGKMTSTTVDGKSETVKLNFKDDVKLNFYNISWQKGYCGALSCEEKLPESARNVINGKGFNIGSVNGDSKDYFGGNFIVEFKTEKVSNSVIIPKPEPKPEKKDDFLEASVETNRATDITETCATLNGYLELNDVKKEYIDFVYGTDREMKHSKEIGRLRRDGRFSKQICGLKENTRYYFRVESDSEDGDILSFRTKKGSYIQPIGEKETSIKTGGNFIGIRAADLYATIEGGDERVICYFEYGKSSTLGLSTDPKVKNVYANRNCYSKATGLTPNTRYYYKAVVFDDGVKYSGKIRTFVTKKYTKPQKRPSQNIVVNENVTVSVDNIDTNARKLQLNKWVSSNKDVNYRTEIQANIGDIVYYKVRVKNNTRDEIKNITVTDYIPYELELSEQRSINDNTDKYLTWKIGSMKSGEVREFVTEMVVSNKASGGDVITSRAEITKDEKAEKTNSVDIYVKDDLSYKQGATIGGSGGFSALKIFFIFGAIILVLVILLLVSRVLATRR